MSHNNNSSGNSNQFKRNNDRDRTLVDHAIRAKMVLVVDGETNNKAVMSFWDALKEAQERGLNLVQMAPAMNGNPPICKIFDYGKFKYDESKKQKAAAKKQREAQIEEKEMTFRPDTAINDLRIKAKKVTEFLDAGARVRVSIRCRGREATHLNVVMDTFRTFLDFIPNSMATPLNQQMQDDGPVKTISFMVSYREE